MFGVSAAPMPYVPSWKWTFKDNHVTGILACADHTGSLRGNFILPYGLTEEQRNMMLWVYEAAYCRGNVDGRERLKQEFKNLLGVER